MKTIIAYRKTNKLTNVLSFLISLTFMIVWLPFLRSIFDGSSYEWGTVYYGFPLGGAGITPDFFFLILQLAFYVALFFAIHWAGNRKLFYGLLLAWFMNVFGNLLADIAINGDTMFHGDTLNVHISLTWIILPLSLLALLLIAAVIITDRKAAEERIPWSGANRMRLWLILGSLPVQAVLLATGDPHGFTDQVGVIITIVQCFLIPFILKPVPPGVESPARSL